MKFPTFTALSTHRKRISRILVRSSVILVTIIALFYAVVNWWGATKRKEAFARLSTSGVPMTLGDLMSDQPAESDNFARTAFLKLANEQSLILDDQNRQPSSSEVNKRPKPGPELRLIQKMDTKPLGQFINKINRIPRADSANFSLLDKGSGYGQSADSFLTEFDHRHATILEALRQGMSRPVTATPLLTPGFEKNLPDAFGEFHRGLRESAIALCLRADAALVAGDSAKAAESLAIALRLGEVIGSKGYFLSTMIEATTLKEVNKRLARGILQHRWTAEDLQDLQTDLARMDLKRHIIKSFEANTHYARKWWNWSDRRPQDWNELAEIWNFGDVPGWVSHNVGLFPSGWFDANGAIKVNRALDFALLVKTPGPLKLWSDAALKPSDTPAKSSFSLIIHPSDFKVEENVTKRCVYMLVLRSQAMLACELERIRLEKGAYPDTLDAISPALTNDPLFDTSFLYRKTEDSFRLYSKGPDGVDDHLERQGRKNLQPSERADWEW